MNARRMIRVLIHCVLPLVIGFLIYLFFRPEVAVIRWLVHREPLMQTGQMNNFQKILIYSGPDFCWCYSLASALFIWESLQSRAIRFFPLMVFTLLIVSELIQGWVLPGFFFDWKDLGAAVLAFVLSFLLTHHKQRHEKKQTPVI